MVAGMFASVDIQQARVDDSNGNHCKDQRSKCSQNDDTPFLLPFP
jgi:hypothetical protein